VATGVTVGPGNIGCSTGAMAGVGDFFGDGLGDSFAVFFFFFSDGLGDIFGFFFFGVGEAPFLFVFAFTFGVSLGFGFGEGVFFAVDFLFLGEGFGSGVGDSSGAGELFATLFGLSSAGVWA